MQEIACLGLNDVKMPRPALFGLFQSTDKRGQVFYG